jgi:nucleotide-binding universal stress UspA family protein
MNPFEKILFAADFSENSRKAFEVACSLAVENRTKLMVLHVVEPSWVPEEPVYFGQQAVQCYSLSPGESRREALWRKLCEHYAPGRALDVTYEVREGDVAAEILDAAQTIGSDLIVMGTHGRTGLRWLLAGSVAIAVLRKAHCPVLALRQTERPSATEGICVILHPTDFSQASEFALEVARTMARDLGARLLVLHVAPLPTYAGGTMAAELDPLVYREALDELRTRVDGPDLKYPVESQVSRGDAADEIVRLATELGAGLIVMGTHGRTGLGRLLMGNVAESVLSAGNCPVLIARAPVAHAAAPEKTSHEPAPTEAVIIF